MNEQVRVVMIHGSIDSPEPMVSEAVVSVEEFPISAHHTGVRVWTAISFDDKRLAVMAHPDLRQKAIERWKSLRVEVKLDATRFGLLLQGRWRHVPN